MKASRYFVLFSIAAVSLTATQCKKNKEEDPEEFKKEAILQNLADNYITPGYSELQLNVNALSTSWMAFAADQSTANYAVLKSDWENASLSFQKVKFLEVGPAMTIGFNAALGTFPADTTQIEANVTSGSYDLTTMPNIDAVGFDALDFLFYGDDAYNKLVTSAARRTYVGDVIAKMKNETDQVVNGWPAYKATFIAGTGTAATSSFSVLVNAFSKDYESAKAFKIGVPIGKATLGVVLPHYFEARRSGLGKKLLQANTNGMHAVFMGNSFSGTSGTGFDDYLLALERSDLASTIDSRLASIASQPASWTGTIENVLTTSPQTLQDYYSYMHGTVVYIKTDMSSAFGVLITYQDNDGD